MTFLAFIKLIKRIYFLIAVINHDFELSFFCNFDYYQNKITMETLNELRKIKNEVLEMKFSYKNIQRVMYLIYKTKTLFESDSPIPNKDIALHQTNKVIQQEILKLITSEGDEEIEHAFNEVIDNYKLVLGYIG